MSALSDLVLKSTDNECTATPYWAIVSDGSKGKHPRMEAGIWFSREVANEQFQRERYNFPKNAYVYCFSGFRSSDLKRLYELAKEPK